MLSYYRRCLAFAVQGSLNGALNLGGLLGLGAFGFFTDLAGLKVTFAEGWQGGVFSAAIYTTVAWVIIVLLRFIFVAPTQLYIALEKENSELIRAAAKQSLSQSLRVVVPRIIIQIRPGDSQKMPASFQGWMFMCQDITLTNKSDKAKLSLEITLRIKMKPEYRTLEMIFYPPPEQLWKYPDQLRLPLSVGVENTQKGSLYFWTGPMLDDKEREGLSDQIAREDMRPIAFLDIRNLITDELISVSIPSVNNNA